MGGDDVTLDQALAAAALGWFNTRLNQAELADAVEAALRAHGRCLSRPEEACDLACGAMECRKYDPPRPS
jgi:hypothetical protein